MLVRVVKNATLTVTAGQEVDVLEREVSNLIRLGLVERALAEKPKKRTTKKPVQK